MGTFFSGLKLSGERDGSDGGLGLARFAVFGRWSFYGTQVWQVLHVLA
jgi:hypothetical protein